MKLKLHSVARFFLTIHYTNPEFVFKRNLLQPFDVPSIFSSEAYVLVHHRLAGFGSRSTLPVSSMRSFNILLQVFFRVGYDPEVVSPHKAAQSILSSPSYPKETPFLFFIHSSLHNGQDLTRHFSATNSQKVRNQPHMCIVVIQDSLATCFGFAIEGSSDVQACHVHRRSYHCPISRGSSLLSIPSVFAAKQYL